MRWKEYIGTSIKTCLKCGSEFKSFISDNKKYCSSVCYWGSGTIKGYKSNRIETCCAECGVVFNKPASSIIRSKNAFCSRSCSGKWWSKNRLIGDMNPNWAGGYTPEAYKKNWTAIKKVIRHRANGKCEHCGGVHKLMDVHHKIPVRLKMPIEITNHLDNLLFLCRPCHIVADRNLRGGYPNQKDLSVKCAD